MRISRSDLETKYGISIPAGKYQINTKSNNYEIYTVKDDTEGCLLVGRIRRQNFVGESKLALAPLFQKVKTAVNNHEKITIEVTHENMDNTNT